jgi:hypothetical protein
MASRTGVRLTPSQAETSTSMMRCPGSMAPSRMASCSLS